MKLHGWGGLLALMLPLGVFFAWSGLGSQSSAASLELYEAHGPTPIGPLTQFMKASRRVAVQGDVELGDPPKNSGFASWRLQSNGVLEVTLLARYEGKPIVLNYVPIAYKGNVAYDCFNESSSLKTQRFCQADTLKSVADIPEQVHANARAAQEHIAQSGVPAGVRWAACMCRPAMAKIAAFNA